MAFDGAAYYGLPTASQASSSNSASPWPAHNGAASHNSGNQHVNSRNNVNGGRGRGIIQRPYSYTTPKTPYAQAYQTSLLSQPIYQQPWSGQPYNAQMWQQPASQVFHGQTHMFPAQTYQPQICNTPVPPLPTGPPPPAPPPLLRHALPPKPQTSFSDQKTSTVPTNPQPVHILPSILKPMRPASEHQALNYREQRVAQPNPAHETNSARPSAYQKTFCDICKLNFHSAIHLIAHQRNEHVKCCKHDEGCKFEGLPNVVELHEQDRHLVFRPGARREKSKPDGPPGAKIQGTNLSLETEEDIAKWIEERKRKWPGSKNSELRLQRDLKRKAYEDASPALSNGQLKSATKRTKHGKGGAAQHPEGYQRAPRVWGQVAADVERQADVPKPDKVASSDDESEAANVEALLTKTSENTSRVAIDGSSRDEVQDPDTLFAIRESDETSAKVSELARDVQVAEMDGESDDESAPEEMPTRRTTAEEPGNAFASDTEGKVQLETAMPEVKTMRDQFRPPCKAWTTSGTCKFGKQCRFEHDLLKRAKPRHEPPPAPKNPFERGDLIGKLVHHEVRHEVSDLTQVIDFLARNDWLVNVELYPGHKQELEGRINEVES